jgi:hypothetical protein
MGGTARQKTPKRTKWFSSLHTYLEKETEHYGGNHADYRHFGQKYLYVR